MNIDYIHKTLLHFQELGYFIEDAFESYDLNAITNDELQEYKNGKERIYPFLFKIEFELFQLLDGFSESEYLEYFVIVVDIILQMRVEKLTFKIMKEQRGVQWKTRDKTKEKFPKRGDIKGIYPVETPDEITNTLNNYYVNKYEYGQVLPLGYKTEWFGYIKKQLIDYIFDIRSKSNLPKNEKLILDSIAKTYHKL